MNSPLPIVTNTSNNVNSRAASFKDFADIDDYRSSAGDIAIRIGDDINEDGVPLMSKIDAADDQESDDGAESTGPSRTIHPFSKNGKNPSNAISNAKYNPITFLPIILYEQFKFFINLYFLLVALSQIVPALRIGYLSSYVLPLAFVLFVTMSKEALDDLARRRRDAESNKEAYEVLGKAEFVRSRDLKVGDLIVINKDQRVPADVILLKSSEATGESFIRTDQLDGETDWKLRCANFFFS